jgi:dipeptide/tripeptide permease
VPFVCNFVAAYMQINYGWGYAFAAAGVGMLIGVVVFMSGSKWVKHADIMKPLEPGDMSTSKILLSTLVPMFIFGVLGYLIPGNLLGTDTNDAFIFGCIPVVAFFIYLYVKANAEDKRPIGALAGGLRLFGDLLGGIPPERRRAHRVGQGLHQPRNAVGREQRGPTRPAWHKR